LDKIEHFSLIFLENLEYFNLDSNEISIIEDYSFKNLKSLENLILSNNKLDLVNNTDILFNALTNVKFINLSSNYIELIQLNTFSNLLKLKVLDLSNNKIHFIQKNSFNGLVNLRDLYINGNEQNMKIENSSFNQFETIKTIFIDKYVLNDSFHKRIFIDMTNSKNILHNKTILEWNYYPAFNLIALNETAYDCDLVIEFIKFNIQYNLKTESDYNNYLSFCQSKIMNTKDATNYISKENKLEINYLHLFLIMLSCIITLLLVWTLYSFFHKITGFICWLSIRLKKLFSASLKLLLIAISYFIVFWKKFKTFITKLF
jgi:hypothetical protein